MLKLRNGWPQTPPFGTMICTLSSVTSSVQNSDSSLTVPRLPPTLHLVADPEGPEDQQHDARRQVGERALQGEPDRQAGGADDGDEARRLDAELRQHREQSDGQDQVAREAAEEALQRRVEMRRPAEHPDHELVGFAREPQPDEQDDDRAERAQRSGSTACMLTISSWVLSFSIP